MKNLPIDFATFSFYERETIGGNIVKNRCGRDFLYYALAYYYPERYGKGKLTPYELEHDGHFGISVPAWLAWTQIQFSRVGLYFNENSLKLSINNRIIKSYTTFVRAILFSRISYEQAMAEVERAVENGVVAGIDLSVKFGGLLDHVVFVYGYDEENLYVFETRITPLSFERKSDLHPQVMVISKKEIQNRWTRFSRVWKVVKK